MAQFKDNLREARRSAGLTQQELAGAIDMSVSAISKLERGESELPQGETLRLIAKRLGCSTEHLLAGETEPGSTKSARRAPPTQAALRELAVNRSHWLWHFLDLYGFKSDSDKREVAERMVRDLGEAEHVTALVARTWLNAERDRKPRRR